MTTAAVSFYPSCVRLSEALTNTNYSDEKQQFASSVHEVYDHQCLITGAKSNAVLAATQIVPSNFGGHWHSSNGLLLETSLGMCFTDLDWTFYPTCKEGNTYRARFSKRMLKDPCYRVWCTSEFAKRDIHLPHVEAEFLATHRAAYEREHISTVEVNRLKSLLLNDYSFSSGDHSGGPKTRRIRARRTNQITCTRQ